MEITQIYAIAAGGIFPMLILAQLLPWIVRFVKYVFLLISEHLIYPYLIHRHRILGPWSRAVVVTQVVYITGNTFCIGFRVSTIAEAGRRAATLAVINIIPLFAGPHLAFLADLLGIPLRIIHRVHRSAGIMVFSLGVFHALVIAESTVSLPLNIHRNLFAVIGGSSLCLLFLLAFPLFRRLSYEFFLRTHQALAVVSVYSVWRHVPYDQPFPRVYIFISAGLFLFVLLLQIIVVICKNRIFQCRLSRATITDCHGAVNLRIHLQKGLKIDGGQYINLWMPWMPFVSFWSFLQTHPFMVISWAPGEQDTIDLLIKPMRGLTQKLLYHATNGHSMNPVVIFSGPHGANVAMDEYESVLMIASGFGITAHLSSLKKLIYGYNARLVRTRRIHLVWQMRDKADGAAAQSFLNSALEEDKLDDGCILSISIYLESHDIPVIPFGERAAVYPGTANLPEIFSEEVLGVHIKKPEIELDQKISSAVERWGSEKPALELEDVECGYPKGTARDGKMLVTVSGNDEIRDQLRTLVRDYIQDGVSLVELDYQPK